jgi:hypothetical protein
LDSGERLTASPESGRFKDDYVQIRPDSIAEVRDLLGITDLPKDEVRRRPFSMPAELSSQLITPDGLEHDDEAVRWEAHRLAYVAAREYVRAVDVTRLQQWLPTINQWLQLVHPVISILQLADIEIADGAELTLSPNTQVLDARRIRIHRTGRLRCTADTKINAESLEGVVPTFTVNTARQIALTADPPVIARGTNA